MILSALPETGVVGVIVIVLALVMRMFIKTDKASDTIQTETITALRNEIAALRVEITALRTELEQERQARMRAEEEAHRYRMREIQDQTPPTTP
jgi:hypothetical protein